MGGSPECQGHPAVLGAPCGVGGLPATWGPWADCSGRGPWRAPALLPPHLAPLCSLCSEPGPLPDPSCHREGQLRQGKASGGADWTRVGWAGRLGLLEGVCVPPAGQASDAGGLGGAVREPATTRLSWPRSLGSCSLAHPQPSWGCRWCAPGLFRGRDPEVHLPFTRAPFYRSRQSGPRPGREVLEKPLRGGLAPCVWSGSDTGAQRPGLR